MTVEVPLTQGHVALIDDQDLELVRTYGWYYSERAGTHYEGLHYAFTSGGLYMHRLITNAPPGSHVDHKNGNGIDNRRENLRICTPTQNAGNRRKTDYGTSQFKGVYRRKKSGLWVAQIGDGYRIRGLGQYSTEDAAACAYNAAARELFGEFALLNDVDESQNFKSKQTVKTPRSGFWGVSWHSRTGLWRARVQRPTGSEWNRFFKDKEVAARAYDAKARELFGESARLNFANEVSTSARYLSEKEKRKTSRFKWVYWHKASGLWLAEINTAEHRVYLGLYDNEEKAARVADAKALELYGDRAETNFSGTRP